MTLPTDPTPYGEYLADMAAAAKGTAPDADRECACGHLAGNHDGAEFEGVCNGEPGGSGPSSLCLCDGFEWPVVARLEQHRADGDEPDPDVATMDDGTILGRQTARALGIAGNGPPDRTTRYYLGVADSGLKVSAAVTARWSGDPRPLPVSALREDLEAATGLGALDPVLVADSSPQLWPVSREVYAAWNDLDVDDLDTEDDDEQRERDQHEADALAASAEAAAADEAWQRHQDEDVTR